VPNPDIAVLHSITSSAPASNETVGDAERSGGLEIDDELQLGGLPNRQMSG
jgi:hypothetical protein